MLGIDLTQSGAEAVLSLSGRITVDSSPQLRNQLLAILHGEMPETVTVNLAGVPYLDFSGIATLIEALKIARHRNKTLVLQGLQGPIAHLLQISGLLALFQTGNVSARSNEKVQ
ncbi:MAG TPA: STAS domain-containing protein [Candidatus Sulfotelmatobacter sp.]|nr:STAS domain-containing protein [Candidatus Sulfotelmatobacter sp.]